MSRRATSTFANPSPPLNSLKHPSLDHHQNSSSISISTQHHQPNLIHDHHLTTLSPNYQPISIRAILVGLLIGTLLAFTNMYFGLQTGWISMMSLQSSILGYAVFKLIPNSKSNPLTVAENVLLQTTSTAVCAMPLTAGLIGIIPALAQLNLQLDGLKPIIFSPTALIVWCFSIAFFGVFLAIPLREQVIIKEKLAFPSGTATAQILALLHNKPMISSNQHVSSNESPSTPQGFHPAQWRLLISTFSISILFSIISLAFPILYTIPIFDVFGPLAHDWSWWFTPSFAFVGQGIIMGFHTTYSMLCGMLFGWMFLSPTAVNLGWASTETVKSWIIWPALSIMIVESLFSLLEFAISLFTQASNQFLYFPLATEEDEVQGLRAKEPHISISFRSAIIGFSVSCIICIITMSALFKEIKWWATVVALALASIFSLLGVRALGETDLNPVSSIAKISQLIFGVIQPHNLLANLVAGGISEAGAMQSGELMQDFKTAQLHDVNPVSMFHGQMIGSFVSVFISSGAYILYSKTYTLPSTTFPVPTAAVWLSLARLLNKGKLPEGSQITMLISGSIFFIIGTIKLLFKLNHTHFGGSRTLSNLKDHPCSWFLPSGIAFALGMINTPSFSLARFIGGLIAFKVESKRQDMNNRTKRRATRSTENDVVSNDSDDSTISRNDHEEANERNHLKEDQDNRRIWLIILATGFVLGEGFGSILNLLLKSFLDFKPLSCWGCYSGGGGYCADC